MAFEEQLREIITRDETTENKFKEARKTIKSFELSKGEKKSRAISLLATYNLFSENDSVQPPVNEVNNKNSSISQGTPSPTIIVGQN